ncbi:deoxynucleoside kinase [Acinetobacter baumannii]|nr:deoxynucleoside kinase [Acinetobacter baumannii]HCI7176182.1 deoxynucleoside kinase [Acinetobacter baumannii]HCJ1343356.1 deoxynucleoside kinase [Acinetobacter baumannii]
MQDKTLGKLIVIEGGDGLGKSTQYNLLKNYLLSLDYEITFFDFPNKTGTPIGNLIGNFLSSKYGAVSPEFLSLAFAIDRFVSKEKILEALNSGKIVLCDRFVLSNIAFQTSKLEKVEDKKELEQLLNWLEYETFNLPKPDIEIVITAPDEHYSKGHHLVRSEDATRSYVADRNADIHEKDSSLQLNVNSYFRSLSSNENRILINAYNADQSRIEVDEIHKRIVGFVNKILGRNS